jgi:hypothetical protein
LQENGGKGHKVKKTEEDSVMEEVEMKDLKEEKEISTF